MARMLMGREKHERIRDWGGLPWHICTWIGQGTQMPVWHNASGPQ